MNEDMKIELQKMYINKEGIRATNWTNFVIDLLVSKLNVYRLSINYQEILAQEIKQLGISNIFDKYDAEIFDLIVETAADMGEELLEFIDCTRTPSIEDFKYAMIMKAYEITAFNLISSIRTKEKTK